MRALITGINGFCGRHLAQHLEGAGLRVFGLDVAHEGEPTCEQYFSADICDTERMKGILRESSPDLVFHLAAVIKSPEPGILYRNNVLGTVSLLESIVGCGLSPRVLVTSSSAVYGSGPGNKPITERSTAHPLTHYGISKVAQESVALYYFRTFKIPVFCSRAFNLIGPGQSSELACSAFAEQIARMEKQKDAREFKTGNLDSFRDFLDVRDAVRAYHVIVEKGRPGAIYNVCSGEAVSIQDCLDSLLRISTKNLITRVDPNRLQANDVPFQFGSAGKLKRHTGWKPEIPLNQSLGDLLDYWRKKISRTSKEKNT